jgi:geranylgeranyl reductase family protein
MHMESQVITSNMDCRYDAVVVGGGPAGASAATTLARGGLRVALLDKARFPRHKLCGGLLSERSRHVIAQVFGAHVDPPIQMTSRGVRLFFRNEFVNELTDYKPLHFTARWDFDDYLLAQAKAAGVAVFEETRASGLSADRMAVCIGSGTSLHADFIVGADGASSRVRKALPSVHMDTRGFAAALEAEVPRSLIARQVIDPEIYLGVVRWGYGWIFPKQEVLTVGIGGLATQNDELRTAYARFVEMAIGRVPPNAIRGHPVPFGNYLSRPGEGSVLLVGDAAGLVEPITGEGIAFAMLSGYYAAQAILEAKRANAPRQALRLYRTRYQEIVRLFDDARYLRYLVFARFFQPLFVQAVGASKTVIMKHMDVLAGDATYRDYFRYFARAVFRQLPHLIPVLGQKKT